MAKRTAAQEAQLGQLRAAYEDAFRELASRVGTWQALAQQQVGDKTAIEDARKLVDQALTAYRQSRDSLAQFMLASRESIEVPVARVGVKAAAASADGSGTTSAVADRPAALRLQVEALAHELWERNGRPIGNPEADWYRAEQMVLQGYCSVLP